MSISDFIYEFERLLNKIKQNRYNISSDILANFLLNRANLPEYHKQLSRATISELKYELTKTQL